MKSARFFLLALLMSSAAAYAQENPAPNADASQQPQRQQAQQASQADIQESHGGVAQEASMSGGRSGMTKCVGPVSYCNIYFGRR